MSDIAIKVENISKRYQIGENKKFPTLRDKLMELPNRIFKGPKKTKEFWALKDVSFEIKKGEIVGIIGRNGAGKSTLLKILARITEPTSGQVTMYGRVASMLEVGTGFNQELTGRENIYLNGAIIGMTKKEIQSKFDDIVEFSGVGKFLDTPVKHYSSGMYVRLAFAVAAHLDADILLVDEVLAVGDAEFQKKCLGKMSDLASSGKTVIFVSHNFASIMNLCRSAILINDGEIDLIGETHEAVKRYYKLTSTSSKNTNITSIDKKIVLKNPYWIDTDGRVVSAYKIGSKPILVFEFNILKETSNMNVGISLYSEEGVKVFTSHLKDSNSKIYSDLHFGKFKIQTIIDLPYLSPGIYKVVFGVRDKYNKNIIYEDEKLFLSIINNKEIKDGFGGILNYTSEWEII